MALKYKIAAVTVAALFIDLLDLTVVTIAVPALRDEFDAPLAHVQWAVTAYILVVAIIMPASGWAADRFGSKHVFLFALGVFTAGSALCAAAWNIDTLIAARAIQGIGGGLLVPVGMAILFRAFPEDERSTASAIFSVPAALAPALGPILGGLFVDTIGWRWVFVINVPIGILAFALAAMWIRSSETPRTSQLDLPGWITGATGILLVTLALSKAADGALTRPAVLAPLSIGVLALLLFVRIETSTNTPMVDLGLFKRRLFAAGNLTMFLTSAGFGALLFTLPTFLQSTYDLSIRATDLLLACHAAGIVVSTVIAPRVLRMVGPQAALGLGITGSAITTGAFALFSSETSRIALIMVLLAAGASFGLLIVPLQVVPFARMAQDSIARGTAILGVIRQLGIAIGTTAAAIPLGRYTTEHAMPRAFLLAAAITLTALLAVHAMNGSKDRSMHQRR